MGVDLSESASPVRILETVLYAHDLAAIQDFYRRVFGLEPFAVAADRHVFYRCGDQMLLIFNPSVTRVPQAQGSFPMLPHGAEGEGHICFRASADEIAAWRQRLEDLGVAIEADFEWPQGGHSIYFRDPAGNCIELAEPRIWGIA
jgi:catechol 2,3-dioxygenase-like lactoylglutathione lyase family enzyme